jgi:hypothetical protein
MVSMTMNDRSLYIQTSVLSTVETCNGLYALRNDRSLYRRVCLALLKPALITALQNRYLTNAVDPDPDPHGS